MLLSFFFISCLFFSSAFTETGDVIFFTLDPKANCKEVPVNVNELANVAVNVTGLNSSKVYLVRPEGGAVMYFPGNEREPYLHYGWALSITPESCAMGTATISPLCGSKVEQTCCEYSTGILGIPPPLLHFDNAEEAYEHVSSSSLLVSFQETFWVWFGDDNCANNDGKLIFSFQEM
jgi:hypothetical protein